MNFDICHQAKQTRSPFPLITNKANSLFEVMHCEVWGLYHTEPLLGAYYFITIIDDHSRGTWGHLMRKKSSTSHILQDFCKMIMTQFGQIIKKYT